MTIIVIDEIVVIVIVTNSARDNASCDDNVMFNKVKQKLLKISYRLNKHDVKYVVCCCCCCCYCTMETLGHGVIKYNI